MRRLASNKWRIAGWIAPAAVALLLIATSVRVAANSLPLYEALWERHGVAERTGITPQGLAGVGRQIQEYFNSSEEPLRVTAAVRGEELELFTPDEVSHMADVKQLFRRTYRAQEAAALLLALLGVAAVWRFRSSVYRLLAQWMRRGAVATAAFVLIVGLLSLIAFNAVFTAFHYLGFPQGNWVFDPRTSYLIQVFPLGFWQDVTITVGLLSLLGAATLWGVGTVALRVAQRPPRTDPRAEPQAQEAKDLVCVGTYPNEAEARLCEGLLRDNGIVAMVRPDYAGYGAWGANQFSPHSLWVLGSNEEAARSLLDSDPSPAAEP